jgi:hypothetical protein
LLLPCSRGSRTNCGPDERGSCHLGYSGAMLDWHPTRTSRRAVVLEGAVVTLCMTGVLIVLIGVIDVH